MPNMYSYVANSTIWVDPFGLTGVFSSTTIWTATSPKGTGNTYKIFQQNIDFDIIDDKGRTNLDRMSKGRAPLGKDGKPMNLHHSKQKGHGPLFEMTDEVHKTYDRTSALHPYKVSGEGQKSL